MLQVPEIFIRINKHEGFRKEKIPPNQGNLERTKKIF